MPFFRRRPIITNLLLALVYATIGQATLALGEFGGVELRRMIWASSGIAVIAGLLLPFPVWIGAALGGAMATFISGGLPLHVVGTGIANGLEVAVAVALLRRVNFDASLERVRDILLLIALASGVAAALGALLSVISLDLVGGVKDGAFDRMFLFWWLTHAMGILLIAPVGLTLSRSRAALLRRDPFEVVGVLAAVAVVSWLPFGVGENEIVSRLFFLPFPLLLWAAMRLGMAGAALGGLITTWIAIVAAVMHWGPMAIGTPNDTLILTWIFSNVVILSTLISAALVEGMRRTREEHALGEVRLRAVLDAASEGIVVADAAGLVTHVNPATARIWPAALQPPAMREPIAQALAPLAALLEAPAERALLTAVPESTGVRGVLTLPDGQVWEVGVDQLSGVDILGARIWSFHDVSARVRAEAERLRLEAQLLHTQKLESLGVLAGGIAHDFNNLLMGIRARAELIGMTERLDPEIGEDVTAILKASDQAAALCRQMLVYAGRGSLAVHTIDLSACAREIQEMLRSSVSRRVDLALALSEQPLWVAGDITQLRQVVLNLVTNASDAVESTGHAGTVKVATRRALVDRDWLSRAIIGNELAAGEFAILEISDDGVGMDEVTARQIFDPFFSSKGAGRGLGLASTLGVIRSHKGALLLETRPGTGTRFQVALPLTTHAGAPEHAAPEHAAPARTARTAFRGRTVLVVDDEPEVRVVVTRMLQGMGLTVRQAGDGDAALEALEVRGAAPIDLVLLDLTMPKRSGPSTLTEMRARGMTVPVIIATGFSAEAVPEGSVIAGFLQKPYHVDALEQAVATVFAEQ